jgi:hypothetical protein
LKDFVDFSAQNYGFVEGFQLRPTWPSAILPIFRKNGEDGAEAEAANIDLRM